MTHENALRTPYPAESARTQIHLVHSNAWQVHPLRKPVASVRPAPPPIQQPTTRVRSSRSTETIVLAAAALIAPLVWVGHALLHLMNIL